MLDVPSRSCWWPSSPSFGKSLIRPIAASIAFSPSVGHRPVGRAALHVDHRLDVADLGATRGEARRLEGDRVAGAERDRQRPRSAAAALLVDREGEADAELARAIGRLGSGGGRRAGRRRRRPCRRRLRARERCRRRSSPAPARSGRSCRRGRRSRARGRRGRRRGSPCRSRVGTRGAGQRPNRGRAPRSGRRSLPPSPTARGCRRARRAASSPRRPRRPERARPRSTARLDFLPGPDPGLVVVGLDLGDHVVERARVRGRPEGLRDIGKRGRVGDRVVRLRRSSPGPARR